MSDVVQKDRRKKKAENDSSEITYFEEVNVKSESEIRQEKSKIIFVEEKSEKWKQREETSN